MLNGKTLMLLLGGVILSGCGPEPPTRREIIRLS